jgi:uncharacterized protein YkvS
MQKLHFIHHLDYNNAGDWLASPLNYFADYFVSRYCIVYHTLEHIKWNEISPDDAVLLGGGGLLDNEPPIQEWINRLLDVCGCVIAWSVGFHRHDEQLFDLPEIDYSRFALITVRDYNHPAGLEYLPCVTCLLPQLNKKRDIKHEIGVINHKSYALVESGFPILDNSAGIDEITDFIAGSETILTTSYHAAYWALLMGKKVIIAYAWANKFNYFKCKPVVLDELSIKTVSEAMSGGEIKSYDGWLGECRELNLAFFERVKKLLERHIPGTATAETVVNQLKQQEWAMLSVHRRIGDIVEQVNTLAGQIEQRFELLEQFVSKRSKSK